MFNPEYEDYEDILEEIDGMSYAELKAFEKKLNELCCDEESSVEENDYEEDDDPTFGNLSLDYHRQPLQTQNSDDNQFSIDSPIRTRSRSRRRNHQTEVGIHISAPALDKQEERLRLYDPESHDLLNKATRSLCSLYGLMDKFDAVERQFFPETRSVSNAPRDYYTENEENIARYPAEDRTTSSHPTVTFENASKRDVSPDRRLRQVLAPEPGRTLYKHDPVNTYHMYLEEWKRRPTPEEQKRLTLRWKVRDYMMSQKFVPKKQPTGEPIEHPKDWSPRPYLD